MLAWAIHTPAAAGSVVGLVAAGGTFLECVFHNPPFERPPTMKVQNSVFTEFERAKGIIAQALSVLNGQPDLPALARTVATLASAMEGSIELTQQRILDLERRCDSLQEQIQANART